MTTEPMAALYAALAAARGAIANPKKGSKADTGSYSYKYADLGTVLDAVAPILAEHGLAALQDVRSNIEHKSVEVSTIIVHASGGWISFGPLAFPATGNPQQTGSAITYARRYTLSAALGVAAEDDDGKAASQARTAPEPDPWATPEPAADVAPVLVPDALRGPARRAWVSGPPSADQKKYLGSLVREAGYRDTVTFLASEEARKVLGGNPSSPLVKGHASQLIDALAEWRSERNEEARAAVSAELDERGDEPEHDAEAGR